MKRAALLYCADCDANRFKVLRHRDQLPFVTDTVDLTGKRDDTDTLRSIYTLDDAFRLRLLLDLLGGETGANVLGGVGPSTASEVVSNFAIRFDHPPLNAAPTDPDLWGGVVVFESPDGGENGAPLRFTAWFADQIGELQRWLAQQSMAHERSFGSPLTPVRIFLANATRAANFVRDRAAALGLPDAGESSGKPE